MTWCTLQSLEDQREQLKELLKDKEDEIQMLATEKSDEQNIPTSLSKRAIEFANSFSGRKNKITKFKLNVNDKDI